MACSRIGIAKENIAHAVCGLFYRLKYEELALLSGVFGNQRRAFWTFFWKAAQ
jgi:hypothetical protein